jgi:hypothetical protein
MRLNISMAHSTKTRTFEAKGVFESAFASQPEDKVASRAGRYDAEGRRPGQVSRSALGAEI